MLYIPEYNRVKDHQAILDFMSAYPFATLISTSDTEPFVTHVPILIDSHRDFDTLVGHMAKANPHWKLLDHGSKVLIVFEGPDAYISPRLYEDRESVPTWNYAVVHAYGRATLATDTKRINEIISQTIIAFDPSYLEQWMTLPEEYRVKMLKQIVAFEVRVEKLDAKFKLSQNRSSKDQENIIDFLKTSKDPASMSMVQLMRTLRLGEVRQRPAGGIPE